VLADLDDGGDGSAAREPTFVGTRRYVRRQRSWFRRDHRIAWLDGAAADNVEHTLRIWRHVS
jgi:tRNA dimethylallyltransferase